MVSFFYIYFYSVFPEMREPPYYINYSRPRLLTHNIITSKYFDLAIAAVIGLNVVTMAMEFYLMPKVSKCISNILAILLFSILLSV